MLVCKQFFIEILGVKKFDMCCEIAFFRGFGRQKEIVTFTKKEQNRILARWSEILSSAMYRYLVSTDTERFYTG